LKRNLAKILATFFGAGFAPLAPGTFGAIFSFIISFGIMILLPNQYLHIHIGLIILSYFAGVWATNEVSKEWGSDPSKVVIDEALGFWVTIFLFKPTMVILGLGLVLFRIFDIWKPLGIRKIDNISHSGQAVMLDDVAAGLVAMICLLLITKYFYIV
jgi:phosphatidylglycerophosphatase A